MILKDERDMPGAFDPSRVRRLLEALGPLCAVVADYATHAGPSHEPHDRILGRIGRGAETPPYVTWNQICEIEDAAYAVARGDAEDALLLSATGGDPAGRRPMTILKDELRELAERVAVAAQRFCSELCEDADGVPQPQLKALHEALDAWEAAQ